LIPAYLGSNPSTPANKQGTFVPNLKLFCGNSNPELARKVAYHLERPTGAILVDRFSDGEIRVEILENVRGRDVYIIQSTSQPCNDNVMELIIMADAFRRASAASITAVIPYFGYSRQDRRVRSSRVPISAKVIADMIAIVGIDRVITVDLHADQIQGFFSIPVDNIYASHVMLQEDRLLERHPEVVVVSPDVGGVVRARAIAKRLNDSELAIIDKRRPRVNQSEVMNVIGDVANKHCVIVDDIVDTAGTLCQAALALKNNGALSVYAYCTHPVLSGLAVQNIQQSCLEEIVVSDTIPLSEMAQNCNKIRPVSISSLIAETISRITQKESVSSMFFD
jgi:ribose-phosphate pyrophosphokinase